MLAVAARERRRHGIDEQHTMLSLFASAASLLPTRIEPRLTRRSACALAALANLPAPPQASALYEGRLTVPAKMDEAMEYLMKYTQTPSGLLYFDAPRGSGFDEVPCRRGCLQRKWAVDPSVTAWAAPSGPILNDVGKTVRIDYRVRRGFFDDEPVALSDGPANGGSVLFTVGDGTVNAAVDELVRSLPPKTIRRAVVPAAFDLDRGTRGEPPFGVPQGTTYLEFSLRSSSASSPLGVCPGGDERYNQVNTCICGGGSPKAPPPPPEGAAASGAGYDV